MTDFIGKSDKNIIEKTLILGNIDLSIMQIIFLKVKCYLSLVLYYFIVYNIVMSVVKLILFRLD